MSDRIYGGDRTVAADDSITVRCSCAAGCIIAFDRWDESDDRFLGEFYTAYHPRRWRDRLKAAWTCIRGREHVTDAIVLDVEAARALGEFFRGEART